MKKIMTTAGVTCVILVFTVAFKRVLLLTCTIFLIATGAVSQSPERGIGPGLGPLLWTQYTVKGEEFSVRLPTLPAMATSRVFQARLGKERLERHLETSAEGVVYTIDIFENPKPRQSLDDFIAENNANSAFDLTTGRNLTVNGFAGKEYSSQNKTQPATVQFFATERRLYRFTATPSPAEHPGVEHFFSSIVLGKKADGTKVDDGPGLRLELATGERVFRGNEVDTKVQILSKPKSLYTKEARKKELSGVVVLKVVFSANGKVTNIRVVSGLPYGLTESAIDAARKITFTPATKDGKPVSMWIQLEYNFNL